MSISKYTVIAGAALFASLSGVGLAAQSATSPRPSYHAVKRNVRPGHKNELDAPCYGKYVVGGGYKAPGQAQVLESRPLRGRIRGHHPPGTRAYYVWRVVVYNPTSHEIAIHAYSICSTSAAP